MKYRQTLIAAVLFLVPLTIFLIVTQVPKLHVPEAVAHLFLTLTAVMGVHLLDRLVLFRETYATLAQITDGIQEDVRAQTKALADNSASLQAMIASDIERLYASREDAAEDMRRDLVDLANTSIRIIGISLNDFVRADDKILAQAWTGIQHAIDDDRSLDIRLLLIDPDCLGAQLRSVGEARAQEAIAGRLREDVIAVAESLLKIEATAKLKKQVKFQCRFYRLPPILFLCKVDSACYVQQYYFWSQRNANRSCPVIRYRRSEGAGEGRLIYHGMGEHFDWVWKHASIPLSEFLETKSTGTDKGLHQCGVANIFSSAGDGLERIRWLLEHARDRVAIQGVSLRSFFDPGPLFNAIVGLIDKEVELRILLIDSACEQAKYRSYRERLFSGPGLSLDEYLSSGQHSQADLYRDTERSVVNLRRQLTAIRTRKNRGWQPNVAIRRYATAPACFMLRVDDRVLVEQYHYGKVVPEGQSEAPAILGKDMPLVEYRQSGSTLYDPIALRSPFALLNNHFEFAFDNAQVVPLDDTTLLIQSV